MFTTDPEMGVLLGGERFSIEYALAGDEAEAAARARDICLEQTVELPEDLVPPGAIRDRIVGRVESFEPARGGWRARVSFAVEVSAGDLVQLLNVVFGN